MTINFLSFFFWVKYDQDITWQFLRDSPIKISVKYTVKSNINKSTEQT